MDLFIKTGTALWAFTVALLYFLSPVYGATPSVSAINTALVQEINELRESKGLSALSETSELDKIAQVRAGEAAKYFSHSRPDGSDGVDMVKATWRGENLSFVDGAMTEEEAVEIMFSDLVASPSHLDNMVFDGFKKIGVASKEVNGKITVAYMFSS